MLLGSYQDHFEMYTQWVSPACCAFKAMHLFLSSSPLLFSAVAAFVSGTSVTVTCTQAALAGGNPVNVTLTASNDGCIASDSMEYIVKTTPTVDAPADDSKCVAASDTSNITITGWNATVGADLNVIPTGCTAGEANHISNDAYCHGVSEFIQRVDRAGVLEMGGV